jgi:hypothetical protein
LGKKLGRTLRLKEGKQMTKIKVHWQASDGYVGKDRPQVATIDASEFEGLSRREAEELFDELMEDAFRNKVSWDCDDYDGAIDEIMAAAIATEGNPDV